MAPPSTVAHSAGARLAGLGPRLSGEAAGWRPPARLEAERFFSSGFFRAQLSLLSALLSPHSTLREGCVLSVSCENSRTLAGSVMHTYLAVVYKIRKYSLGEPCPGLRILH